MRTSQGETLLIGGALDFATPPQDATTRAPAAPAERPPGRAAGLGHTDDFWTQQPKASTHLVNTFLDSGTVDASLYAPIAVDFTPEVTQTALAKGLAGGDGRPRACSPSSRCCGWHGGCAGEARFGRKAGATLRSLYPLVLGLGGWFLGVLIVITTMPGVPLDSELLAGALGGHCRSGSGSTSPG